MKKLVISIIFIITMIPAFAQIENEMQQTKKVKIENGRAYLLEKFLERDYEKVKEITDYLLDLEDDNYCALSMSELWLLPYWTQDFDLLTTMLGFDSTDYEVYEAKILPVYDQLYAQLYRHSIEDEHLLHSNLQEAELSAEDREFLTIYLDWVLDNKCYNDPRYNYGFYYYGDISQKEYNERLDQFLAKYPDSRYAWVAKNIVHRPYWGEPDWGFGFLFNIGTGFSTGKMQKPNIGIGMCWAILYKRFELDLCFDIMSGGTYEDQTLSNDSIYPKGSHVNVMPLYANLNYYVIDNKLIRLAPALGIGCVLESYPTAKNSHNKELDKSFFIVQGSIACDFKLKGTFLIRLRYSCGLTGLGKGDVSTLNVVTLGIGRIERNRKFIE